MLQANPEAFSEEYIEQKKQVVNLATILEKAQKAFYLVAQRIVKSKKPHTSRRTHNSNCGGSTNPFLVYIQWLQVSFSFLSSKDNKIVKSEFIYSF